jgi:methylenetetrahydrofolate/methylenetetrahydromethanopterin dehydrogenase (NADP+)
MLRLLVQLDTDRLPSAFDRIVAHDAGADQVLAYGSVGEADVAGLVHGALFTRGPKNLKHTALFIGGSRVPAAEALLQAATRTFFGPFRVSALLDPGGCNTTAAAAVLKLVRALGGELRGRRAAVLAGTGPVGLRAAGLLLRQGAEVRISSRDAGRGAAAAAQIGARFGGEVGHVVAAGPEELSRLVEWAELLLAAGAAGAQLVPRASWAGRRALRAVADVNAVPPLGLEGCDANDDGVDRDGTLSFGALGIGGLKMKVHKAAIARLFETNDLILDAEEIYDLAAAL